MRLDTSKLETVLGYLDDFAATGYRIEFGTEPDADAPPGDFDYHIHKFWELKFYQERNLLSIHPPETVHCMTGNDLVIAATFQYLLVFDQNIEFSEEDIHYNLLPELLRLLAKLPDEPRYPFDPAGARRSVDQQHQDPAGKELERGGASVAKQISDRNRHGLHGKSSLSGQTGR